MKNDGEGAFKSFSSVKRNFSSENLVGKINDRKVCLGFNIPVYIQITHQKFARKK
jgi:hypothetical protein